MKRPRSDPPAARNDLKTLENGLDERDRRDFGTLRPHLLNRDRCRQVEGSRGGLRERLSVTRCRGIADLRTHRLAGESKQTAPWSRNDPPFGEYCPTSHQRHHRPAADRLAFMCAELVSVEEVLSPNNVFMF